MSSTPLRSPSSTSTRVTIDVPTTTIDTPAGATNTNTNTTATSSPVLKSLKTSPSSDFHPMELDGEKSTWVQRRVLRPLQAKVVTPMINILKSGATPEGIALSLALGITGGMFPVPATTTVVCVLFAYLFQLNLAAVQLTNLLMTPINLATFMTFIRYGEALFGAEPVPLSLEPFQTDPLGALATFWISLCYGIVAWAIFTPPATFIAYQALKPVLRKAMAAMFQKPD